MNRLSTLALAIGALACATTGPQTLPTQNTAQVQPAANTALAIYEGTYALEAPSRTIELRVWVGDDQKLHGELIGLSQQTTFRPNGDHKFLHATRDDIWFLFTVEDGRATAAMMSQRGRVITGPRIR